MNKEKIKGMIWGGIVGDALGVPVEFKSREYCQQNPITDMIGYGTHNQPAGTWSDDTSLTLCLIDQINIDKKIDTFNVKELNKKMLSWLNESKYTAHNQVFDCGSTVHSSLVNGSEVSNNFTQSGNGALMRIAPIVVLLEFRKKYWITVNKIVDLTHKYLLNYIVCKLYLNLLYDILKGDYTLKPDTTAHQYISSSGFIINTFNAALWCFNNTSSFEECVLKAVNLGDDSDTVGSIAGQLAGAYYGYESIPKKWIECLQNKELLDLYINPFIENINESTNK